MSRIRSHSCVTLASIVRPLLLRCSAAFARARRSFASRAAGEELEDGGGVEDGGVSAAWGSLSVARVEEGVDERLDDEPEGGEGFETTVSRGGEDGRARCRGISLCSFCGQVATTDALL